MESLYRALSGLIAVFNTVSILRHANDTRINVSNDGFENKYLPK